MYRTVSFPSLLQLGVLYHNREQSFTVSPTNRSICYKSYDLHHTSFLNSHLVGAVTSNVTGLSALAADRILRALAGNVTGLSTVTAHGSVGAVTSDVTGLAAVVAHSLVGALAGNVSELSAVAAHDVLVAGTLLSIGAVTSLVTHLAAVVALGLSLRLLSGLYSLNSKRLHYCSGNHEPCGQSHRSCSTPSIQ